MFDAEVVLEAESIVPQVTWGTSPEMVIPVTGNIPTPDDTDDPTRKAGIERALEYMGLEGGAPITSVQIDKVFIGSCTNSHEDLRAAAEVVRQEAGG